MNLVPDYQQDVTVYLVVNDFGQLGKAYVETDIAEADREAIIRNFISGQYSNALCVVAFNTPRARNGRRRPRCGAVTIRPSERKLEPRIDFGHP
jgi:hypothetical protein